MFPNNNNLVKIADIINKGASGLIVLCANPSVDAIASATSLYISLNKMGKSVGLACSTPVKSDLVASDKIQPNLTTSGDNLVISFPYSDGAIDKVDYNIQGNFFNLTIIPRPGALKINPDQVRYSYSGGNLDFIITIDAPNLNSLGNIYTNFQNVFQGKSIINIDRHLTNSYFGLINLVNKSSSSTSEMILKIIRDLNAEIDREVATNLYTGLVTATNNFTSYSVNADTFQAASELLKMGAQKKAFKPTVKSIDQQPLKQTISFEKPAAKPIGMIEKEPQTQEGNTPQDWLKPKIFKGSDLI
jgi:nanoRNase/pAp phosphatase (c-di-AMP/oligoRNAs hydrolase)